MSEAGTTGERLERGRWTVTRAGLALGLVLLYAAGTTARWLHRASAWPAHPGADPITANDQRFAAIRADLPAHGTVGYLGDPAPTGPTPRDSVAAALHHFRRYLLAQYALAPLVVVETPGPELVVGNFDTTAAAPAGMELVRDFGGGLVLYRRTGP